MTIKRLDHVSVVVDDLAAAFSPRSAWRRKARCRSRARGWADEVSQSKTGRDRTGDRTRWASGASCSVDDTVARLRANGTELVGEVAQYEDKYRLCYMRGPAGIIVALAEELFW